MPAQKVQEKHAQEVQHFSVTLKGVPWKSSFKIFENLIENLWNL